MFAKLTTIFGLFVIAAQVVVATPPACVIAAVNQAPDPADIKAVCKNDKVTSYITDNCGDNTDAANDYYADVCKDAGVTVSSSDSTSTKSSSHSASATGTKGSHSTDSDSSPTGTLSGGFPVGTAGTASSGFYTATTNGTYSAPTASGTSGSPASSTTGAGGAQSTGAASRLSMDAMGLAAVGVFGAMLAL